MLNLAAIVAVVLMSSASVAAAQSTSPPNVNSRRVFFEASAIGDYDQTDFAPGPVLAGGFGVGAQLWQRYSLRFEFDQPRAHVWLDEGPGIRHRWSSTTTSFAFLLGRHFRTSRRVQFVALLGASALTHRSDLTGFIVVTPRDGRPAVRTELDDRIVEQWVALSLGLEVPVFLTEHLRLVPQIRTHQVANSDIDGLFPSGKSVLRPRLSLRWQF